MRSKELYAVSLAVTLHALVFLLLDFPRSLNTNSVQPSSFLSIQLGPNKGDPAEVTNSDSSPLEPSLQILSATSSPDLAVKQQPVETNTSSVASVVSDPKEKQKTDSEVLSLQESLNQWLSDERGRTSTQDSKTFDRFKKSFAAPSIEEEPELLYEDGQQGALGGGIYKIRKNGVTCEQLNMVPMTMDDHLYGTISIIDNCSEEEKIKVKVGKSK